MCLLFSPNHKQLIAGLARQGPEEFQLSIISTCSCIILLISCSHRHHLKRCAYPLILSFFPPMCIPPVCAYTSCVYTNCVTGAAAFGSYQSLLVITLPLFLPSPF